MKNFGTVIDNFDAVTKQYVDNKGYATKTYVDTQDNKKLDKAGGAITGDLTVGRNLTVNGTTTTVDSTTLQVKDKLIEVAHGNTTSLTTPAGLVAPKYDGRNSGALVFDSTGTAYVGDVMLKDGNIDVTKGGLQPLATRTGLVGGNLVQYDSSALTLKDSGKKISDLALKTDIPNTAKHSSKQLATNTDLNTLNSSDDIGWYHVGGGNSCAHKPTGVDAFGLEVGRSAEGWFYQVLTSSNASTSRGRRFIRTYTGTAWDGWTKVAITSEIPTKTSEITNDSGFITSDGSVKSVIDYNKADERVKIGYSGVSLASADIKYIAGYTAGDSESVARIKDIPKDTLKSWLEYATVATSGSYNDLVDKPTIPDISGKLDKTTYEVNKTIAFGRDGALYIGKFKVYDTNVTFEITSTTDSTYSGKLVIATQNYAIREMTVYGDAANTVAPNIYIKPSSESDPYIEVYFKPESWSKNVIHIYGSEIKAEPTDVCTSIPAVPSTATLKPKNALDSKANLSGGNTFTGTQVINGYLDIRGTAAEKHLKTRGIGGSDGMGNSSDLYLQYSSNYKTYFGNTAQSSLNADGSISIKGSVAMTKADFSLSGTTLTITL